MKNFLVLLFAMYNYIYCIDLDKLVVDLKDPTSFLFIYDDDNVYSDRIPLSLTRVNRHIFFLYHNYSQSFDYHRVNSDVYLLVARGIFPSDKFSYGILHSDGLESASLWLKEKDSEIGKTVYIIKKNKDDKLQGVSKLNLITKCKKNSYSVQELLKNNNLYASSPYIDYVSDKQMIDLSHMLKDSRLWRLNEKNLNGSYESSLFLFGLISNGSLIIPSLFYIYCPLEHSSCLEGHRNEKFALILTKIQDSNKVSLIIDPSLKIQDYLIDWVEKINPEKNALTCLVKEYSAKYHV